MKNDRKNSSGREKTESSALLHLRLHQPVHLARVRLSPGLLHHLANDKVQSPLASRPIVRNRRAALRTASRPAFCAAWTPSLVS